MTSTTTPVADCRAQPAATLLGCPQCDLLVRVVPPAPGRTARCPRCSFGLASGIRDGFVRPLAYALAALVFMVLALTFPFLGVSAAGLESAMTLTAAVASLAAFGAEGVAVLFAAFVLLVPGLLMLAAVVVTGSLLIRRGSPLLVPLTRALFHLDTWSMADVFAIGVIVSLVKLATMADVMLGAAFWAYLGFAVCFLLTLTSLDRVAVWSAVDDLRSER